VNFKLKIATHFQSSTFIFPVADIPGVQGVQ